MKTTMLMVMVVLMGVVVGAESAVTCDTVNSDLSECLGYVAGETASPTPRCCNGANALYAQVNTTDDRRAVCRCLLSEASSFGASRANVDKAVQIPSLCGIRIPHITVTPNFNCNSIN